MKFTRKQSGSTHVVIIVLLVVAVIGLLGFVFWQNFVQQKVAAPVKATQTTTDATKSEPVATKQFKSQDHAITFQYPNDWTVSEVVSEDAGVDWYGTSINVKNSQGKSVAQLHTGGGFGGTCEETAPFIKTTTIIKDSMSLKGVGEIAFGYTIIETDATNYGVAFGLVKDDIVLGEKPMQCPGMGVNYSYVVPTSTDKAVGDITFGLWYAQTQTADDPNTYKLFTNLADAKAYAQSAEFKQIESMIKSFSIGA